MVGKVEKDRPIKDRSYMIIGKVEDDRTVIDCNNMQIGRVKRNGTVVDRNNMVIGHAKDVPTRYAAVFFLLQYVRIEGLEMF